MPTENIFYNLGAFDSKYLGVKLSFSNSQLWKFYHSDLDDLSILNNDEKFIYLSMKTVLGHEVRHFHDFFLSSYSINIFRKRIQALLNGWHVLIDIENKKDKINTIPIPITIWSIMNQHERDDQIKSFYQFGYFNNENQCKIYEVPFMPDKEIDFVGYKTFSFDESTYIQSLLGINDAYTKIESYLFNDKTVGKTCSIQPWHLSELSAVITQYSQIKTDFGEEEAIFFLEYLINSTDIKPTYINELILLFDLWQKDSKAIDFKIINAILSWSLIGDYSADKWNASPETKFIKLIDVLIREGVPENYSNIMDLFEDWSEKTKTSNVKDALIALKNSNNKFLKVIQDILNTDNLIIKPFSNQISNSIKMFVNSSNLMIDEFLNNPDTYVYTHKYLDYLNKYINPNIIYEFGDQGLSGTYKDFENAKYELLDFEEYSDDEILVKKLQSPIKLSNIQTIDKKVAYDLNTHLTMIDFHFSPFEKEYEYYKSIVERYKKSGIVVLNII